MKEKCFCHITDKDGNEYAVKDATARKLIEELTARVEALEGKHPEEPESLAFELLGSAYKCVGIGTFKGTEIIIPDDIDGIPVTEIADYAFKGNKNITTATIGKNVDRIGKEAFLGCDNLSAVHLLREAHNDGSCDWDYSCHYEMCMIRLFMHYTTPEQIAAIMISPVRCEVYEGEDSHPYTTDDWIWTSCA